MKASATLLILCLAFPSGTRADPIAGCFDLVYSVSGISYESRLVMQGEAGYMRTRYYDTSLGRTADVGQSMRLGNSARGVVIYGYNPVYYGTSTSHPTYSPDNFLFRINPSGSYVFKTCDDAGRCSDVDIEVCP